MPRIRVEGMGVVEFPDSMSPEEIKTALDKQYRETDSYTPTAQDLMSGGPAAMREKPGQRPENLPMVGGMVGGALGGIPGAALGGAMGESARQLAVSGTPAAPTSASAAAGGIVGQGALQGGIQALGTGIGKAMEVGAPWLMQKALKPTATLLEEYRTSGKALAKTLLDEGVNVSYSGLEKLQNLFKATNQEIKDAVASATGTISKKSVASRAAETALRMSRQVNPKADLAAVGDSVNEFLNHPVMTGPTLTPAEAQAMKIGTYQEIGKSYGERSSATIETQKALARGLKEDIASEVPQIAALNKRDSDLMAAMEAVGRRAAMSGNRDPVGFAWVAAHPATFLAALADRSTSFKSLLARGAYQSAGTVAGTSPQLIRAAVVALATSEGGGEPAQESNGSSTRPGSQ